MSNTNYLKKGTNTLLIDLLLMFLSPIVFNIGLKALEKDNIYFILIIGIILITTTIILFVLGIHYILKHLFQN